MTDSEETARLLQESHAGNDAAFEQLLERHRPRLLASVRRRLNPKLLRRIDPSDVVQETHLEVLRRRDDYLERQPMPFSLWLLKTAHQRVLRIERDHLRTAKRAIDRELPLPDESTMALAQRFVADGTSPSRQLRRQEAARHIRRTLARLSETNREIILLRNFEGLSNTEASQLLEISEDAAKKRYTRAVLQLQRLLHNDGYTESIS
jgi:RNA polymerase sigma-70 factor (ECF subfamily)